MIRFKRIKGNIKERLPRLIKAFRRKTEIGALYLFGSYAKDDIKPLSDIDIAVFLKRNIPSSEYWDLKINILNKAVKILGTEEIDFVLLNEAPYELAYNILKTGRILFCCDEKYHTEFQEKIVLNYLDTKPLREEGFFHLKERIKKGRFSNDQARHNKDFAGIRRIFGRTGKISQSQ